METHVIRSVETIKRLLDEELEVALLRINEEKLSANINDVEIDYEIAKSLF